MKLMSFNTQHCKNFITGKIDFDVMAKAILDSGAEVVGLNEMRDTAELFDSEKLSFPSDAPNRKIDYIFVSNDVSVLDADIPPIVASDHRPHTATVVF